MPLPISRARRVASAAAALSVAATAALALAAPPPVAGARPAHPAGARVIRVVVAGTHGAMERVAADVRRAGGRVTSHLQIIDGVAATVPADALEALRADPAVRSVSPDTAGHLMGAADSGLGYDPAKDDGSLNLIEQAIHAKDAWKKGYTGKGVDVALIDSGVSPVSGLTDGNVINGPDLSFDSQQPNLTQLDGFGHGTHMASIIAGRDFTGTPAQYGANNNQFLGVAPDARVVSVKVAAANGAADVSQVIAALNWVDQNAHRHGLNIRVINLSYGTDSTQPYSVDPLAYAAEQAWRHGIVVVTSAGNEGTSQPTLTDPAYDPNLLAVGAVDPNGTPSAGDDTVADFSSRGNAARHVDVVAPGMHVLGLDDPGSYVDDNNPGAEVGSRFFRGSGTSQAAAVVSGAVAILAQRYASATPDQLKSLLMGTAASLKASTLDRGTGEIDVNAALGKSLLDPLVTRLLTGLQNLGASSDGSGSLDAARGGDYVVDDSGNALTGEQDIFGNAWQPASWAADVASQSSWGADGSWNASVWTGTGFTGFSWAPMSWAGVPWSSNTWSGDGWDSHHWTSHHWTNNGWTGGQWNDADWTSHHWTGTTWTSWHWG